MTTPAHAGAKHCLALWGECKYAPGFTHFDYVNPNAPVGGMVKLAETGTFDSVQPLLMNGVKAPGSLLLFESLMVQSQDEPMSFYGLIAESVEVAKDNGWARFVLRPQARFHDGTPITADDVVFSLNTLREKADPTYKILYAPISHAEASGPRVVTFYFTDKTNRELPTLAAQMPIVSKAYYEKVEFSKTTLTPPVGSGPYVIESVEPGRQITYKRLKEYWGAQLPVQRGQNNFERIRYDLYRDENVALQGLFAGEYDFRREYIARNWATAYDTPPVKDGRILKRNLPDQSPQGMQAFMFNTRKAAFADRRVREAIALTLDYEWVNKAIFYGAYARNRSFFQNTDFEAKGLPAGKELELLAPYDCRIQGLEVRRQEENLSIPSSHQAPLDPRPQSPDYCLPENLFTQPFENPTTDGSGNARENLLKAQQLLNDAGWRVKDGKRVDARGQTLSIEFLLRQPTMERVIGPMRKNLERLGIGSSIRMVDDAQYQKRLDTKDFDITSVWINRAIFYPGNEQTALWHSSQADVKGGNNLSGAKNPAVDALLAELANPRDFESYKATGRALDRVLLWEHYVIPNWHSGSYRVAYWNKFGMPHTQPKYDMGFRSWWVLPHKATATP